MKDTEDNKESRTMLNGDEIIMTVENLVGIFMFFSFLIFWVGMLCLSWKNEPKQNKESLTETYEKNKIEKQNKKRFSEYKMIYGDELKKLGIDDIVSFEEELYSIFEKFQIIYYSLNLEELTPLCTEHYLKSLVPKIKRAKKNQDKIRSYEVRENFELNRRVIYYASENGYLHTVSIVFDVSFAQYVKGENGNIVGGNPYKLQRAAFDVTFQRSVKENDNKKCLNCGAPINSHHTACEYCLTELDNPYGWKITSIINKIAIDSYIEEY